MCSIFFVCCLVVLLTCLLVQQFPYLGNINWNFKIKKEFFSVVFGWKMREKKSKGKIIAAVFCHILNNKKVQFIHDLMAEK